MEKNNTFNSGLRQNLKSQNRKQELMRITMENQWCFKTAVNQSVSQLLAEELQVPAKISTILVQRGIENFEEAKSFFRPRINQLHSPFLMKDMESATKRVVEAIQKNQNIF